MSWVTDISRRSLRSSLALKEWPVGHYSLVKRDTLVLMVSCVGLVNYCRLTGVPLGPGGPRAPASP